MPSASASESSIDGGPELSIALQWQAERGARCPRREDVARLLVDELDPELEFPLLTVLWLLFHRDIRFLFCCDNCSSK
jgi:hypothetical protein